MKPMRPFQIIVLAVFGVAALGGLVIFATFQGFNHAKPLGTVTIWGTLPVASVQAALDDVKRTHQEFSGVVYIEKGSDSFDADLSDALAAGTGPDLIITTNERLLSEENKLDVIPFSVESERAYTDSYLPISSIFLTGNGFYGIPIAVDPLVLYYNRARLSTGAIAGPPASWESVVGETPRLTSKSSLGQVNQSAIALGTYDNIPNARAIISLLLLQAGNPIVDASANGLRAALLSSSSAAPEGTLPAEAAMSFYTQFADPAKIVYTWNRSIPDARQSFVSGDTALYVGFASERALIAASNPNLDFDIAAIPQPQTSANAVDFARVYAFAIPKAGKNPTGALAAARMLAEDKTEAGIIPGSLGLAPALQSLITTSPSDRYAPVIYKQALISKGWLSPSPAATDRIFAAMINGIISGSVSVHDALAAANEALSAAL